MTRYDRIGAMLIIEAVVGIPVYAWAQAKGHTEAATVFYAMICVGLILAVAHDYED